ncbi:SIR2 family NAD-dependent protein deacylase [Halococcus saccharolyticus]|uniref:NAD-dependent protein deacetylase n=1 Tax=Halococcus saccharolyticus DSM 5350 TaxID=1227455 RepID=M0MPE8_9EURY|nr:Sir2 family NAD-dependent protein deacetylase [Halococcus saccharolyticus]EMA47248.1 NAD-dependent protein deacetylase [Halococcus saccharolyticus DSM 5350]
MTVDADDLRFAARVIREADTAVAMTGAGASTASGIPDFRGDDGLWDRHDPDDFHVSRLDRDPGGFWRDRLALHDEIYGDAIEPNAAHEALADLESTGHLDRVVTQNIDGLHVAAGSEGVVTIHGSGQRSVCRDCGRRVPAEPVRERARDGELPPRCEECEGVLKPGVVLFGESLPEHALFEAQSLAERADVFLVAGSSLTVEPAASLPRTAADRGATMVLVNLERTPLSDRAEYDFRADVTDVLPRLRDAVVTGDPHDPKDPPGTGRP